MAASRALSAYVPGTKAWFTDKDLGWISATLAKAVSTSASGDVVLEFTLDDGGATREVRTTREEETKEFSVFILFCSRDQNPATSQSVLEFRM